MKLSIIIPVYNEKQYFEKMLKKVLAVKLPLDREIIIVESNSKDGTREIVKKYEDKKGFKIIYEDAPHGKGAAVKMGLKAASGDIILIQDSDLEYDPNDYPKLLAPILKNKTDFVLGSRHLGKNSWKIRKFHGNKLKASFINIGSQFLDTTFWMLYGKKLTDPQTMYKVFRKKCMDGIKLNSDHFQMDFEMVIKLMKKGYIPLEIPITYNARSHSEGKKVPIIKTGFQDLYVMFKYRFFE